MVGSRRASACRTAKKQVQLTVEDERRAWVDCQAGQEAFVEQRLQGLGATGGPEAAGDDRIGDRRWIAHSEEPSTQAIEARAVGAGERDRQAGGAPAARPP